MTEAKQTCTAFISWARSVHKKTNKQLYTFILLCLAQPTTVTVPQGMYTVWSKASCTLTWLMKTLGTGTGFMSHRGT